jgi:hypothetical protein
VRVFAALAPWWQLPWRGVLADSDERYTRERIAYLRGVEALGLLDAKLAAALIARERVRQARDALKGRK